MGSAPKTPAVPQFTLARRTRPSWIRPVNGLGRVLTRVRRPDVDTWLAQATHKAADKRVVGVTADATVVEALGILVESLRAEAELNLIGRFSAQQDTVRLLTNHLRIKAYLAQHPEVADTALPQPVFVIGIPRSGTTFMHHLLSCDPDNRVVPYWESYAPLPPVDARDPLGVERAAKVETMLKQLRMMAPNYQAIHPMAGASPEECVALFMNLVRTLQMDIQYRVPTYTRWLIAQDATIAYDAYAAQLRLIQHLRPAGTRFVLKDPAHTFHLDSVLKVFPHAKLVFLYRDPVETVSSICSLYAHTRAIFSDAIDPMAVGPEVLGGHWPEAFDRMLSVRGSLPDDQYVDVRQADLARDPVGTAQAVYAALGWNLTDGAERSMSDFVAQGIGDFRRRHEHSLEGFGLVGDAVRERFAGQRSVLD